MIVKGIVLYQPYAWAMFHGKDVENRKVRTNHRGPLVIIAAKSTPTPKFVEGMLELRKRGLEAKDAVLRTGGILGAVEIWDVEPPMHQGAAFDSPAPLALPRAVGLARPKTGRTAVQGVPRPPRYRKR